MATVICLCCHQTIQRDERHIISPLNDNISLVYVYHFLFRLRRYMFYQSQTALVLQNITEQDVFWSSARHRHSFILFPPSFVSYRTMKQIRIYVKNGPIPGYPTTISRRHWIWPTQIWSKPFGNRKSSFQMPKKLTFNL